MLEKKLQENKEIVDAALNAALAEHCAVNSEVSNAMRYAVLNGGKRLRAFLVRHVAEMFGGKMTAALPFAVAIELGHTASLIHDDLPCMDDAALRHGKPACHLTFGEATAVLAGDALLALAFKVANENPYVNAEVARYAVKVFAEKAGAKGMCLGQELDLSNACKCKQDLFNLYDLKTGSSLQAAALLGVLSVNEIPTKETREELELYTRLIGRIFQISDDLLDATKTEKETGKSSGIDERNGTKTIFSFLSQWEMEEHLSDLAETAAKIFDDPVLQKLPRYLAEREV